MEFELIVTKCQCRLLLLDLALSSGSFVIIIISVFLSVLCLIVSLYVFLSVCCCCCLLSLSLSLFVLTYFAQCIYLFAFFFLSHAIIWVSRSSHSFFACRLQIVARLVLLDCCCFIITIAIRFFSCWFLVNWHSLRITNTAYCWRLMENHSIELCRYFIVVQSTQQ